jgi:hypothetical protein
MSSMLARATMIFALVVLVAAGCGGDGDSGNGGGGGGDEGDRLAGPVSYKRAGGIAGRIDTLTLQPDGSGTIDSFRIGTKRFKLTSEELDALAGELAGVDLASVPAETTSSRRVPDAIAHRLTYDGRTIETDDPSMPKAVRGLFARLGALVDQHRPK